MVELYRRPGSPYWYFDLQVGGERHRRSTKRTKKSEAEAVAQVQQREALNAHQFGATRELTLREALFDHYLPSVEKSRSYVNLKRFCEEHLAGRYDIEVIDLMQNPQLAAGDQILAIPTLVRRLPSPLKRIIGDLSNTEKVLVGLDIRPKDSEL